MPYSTLRPGKPPFILRWALMMALLRGTFVTISVDANWQGGTVYRFDVRPASVDRWLKRRLVVNKKKAAAAAAAEDRAIRRAQRSKR
jgi:hypothetical protein